MFQVWLFQTTPVESRHYSFTTEGPILFSSSMAHIAVPLQVKPIEDSLPLIHRLVSHVNKMAKKHPSIHQLEALSHVVTEEFTSMSDKLNDVFLFFLKHSDALPEPLFRKSENNKTERAEDSKASRRIEVLRFGGVEAAKAYEFLKRKEQYKAPEDEEIPISSLPQVADLPVWKTIKIKSKRQKRKKRFFGGLVAGLLAAIGTSTLFGLFEGSKIEQLGQTLQSTISRQEQMIHLLDQEDEEIRTNRLAIKVLSSAVASIEEVVTENSWLNEVQSITLIVRHELMKVNRALNLYVDAIQAASNHRLAYGVLSFEAAQKALNDIITMAEKKQLTPILQTPHQIHQLPTSFLTSEDGVTLLLHVPLASEDTVFSLKRFTSFPLSIGKDVFGHIHADKTLIALGSPDINHKPSYVELDEVELTLCHKFYSIYICPHSRVISRPTRPSCLHALYHGEHEAAIKLCKLHLSTDDEDTVIPLSQHNFVSFTKKPAVYAMNCHANSTIQSGLQLYGIQTITVPEGCQAILPKYKIHAASDIYYSAPPKAFTWTIPPLKWLEADMSITDLSSAVKKLEGMKGLPKIDPHQVELVKRMSVPVYENTGHQISWVLAGIAALGCSLVVLGVCAKAWCCGPRSQHLAYSGVAYRQEHETHHGAEEHQEPIAEIIRNN